MNTSQKKFGALYDEHVGKIYRFIYLKVESAEIAEDLCSEVFTRSWEKFSQKNTIENPRAFIYQIARHVIADHYREKEKVNIVVIEEIAEEANSLEEQAIVNLEMERVRKLLLNLKEEYQNYIIWKYIDELSAREISEITGKAEEAVRVGAHRALQALKREYGEHGVGHL